MLYSTCKIEHIITEPYAGKYIQTVGWHWARTNWAGRRIRRFQWQPKYSINTKSYSWKYGLWLRWWRYIHLIRGPFEHNFLKKKKKPFPTHFRWRCSANWMGSTFTSASTAWFIIAIKCTKSTTNSQRSRWLRFKRCTIDMARANNGKSPIIIHR